MFTLTIDVDVEGAPAPTRSVIQFDLPADATDDLAVRVARGIRKAFRDEYASRVRVIGLQRTGLTRDMDLGVN